MKRGIASHDLSLNERVMIGIVRVAELFKKETGKVFRNYGLTFAQYSVLRILDASIGGKNNITNVVKIMLSSGANLTGIVQRLEQGGFLLKRHNPNDDRVTILEITSKGRQTLVNISRTKDAILETFPGEIQEDHKKELLEQIKAILKSGSRISQ